MVVNSRFLFKFQSAVRLFLNLEALWRYKSSFYPMYDTNGYCCEAEAKYLKFVCLEVYQINFVA